MPPRAVRACSATVADDDPEAVRIRAGLARVYAATGDERAEELLGDVISRLEAQKNESELAIALNARGVLRQNAATAAWLDREAQSGAANTVLACLRTGQSAT